MLLYDLYREALQNTPDKPALIVDDTICTYRELHEVSEKWAQALLHCGVRRGDRISILMGNRIEYFQLYFACYRIGAIASPMSCVYQTLSDEVAFAVNLIKSKVLMVSSDYYPGIRDIKGSAPSLESIFVIDECDDERVSWKRFVQEASGTIPWPEVQVSDPALIIFTSGSTDRPKGVTHSHHSILQGAINKSTTMQLGNQDIYLIATMLCHASGSFGFSLPITYTGGTVIFMGNYNTPGFLDLIEKHHPTHVTAVPTEVREIIEHPRSKQIDFSSIKTFMCGGDTVTHDILVGFHEITGFELNQGYGSTECEEFCMNPPYGKNKRGSIGLPVHGAKVRLIDAEGRDVLQGETGEIVVQNEATMVGYWDDPVNTGKAFIDGWLRTGDLAYQDEEGYYFFVGRIKNIIVKGGGNIAPAEVEDAINEHPGVKVSGVVGTPDVILGQIVHAFVVVDKERTEPGPSEEELKQFVGKKLSAFKVPDRWTFVESLPQTSIGKIDRKALAEFAEKHTEQIRNQQ
ncbi:MAG: class I adenylate-forming enzyme family protein [Candidatus Xenobiia bacterium LiM19]